MAVTADDLITFDEFITHWASDRPDRLAMREEDRAWSYADLEERTARVATALLAAGLKPGERIAWIGKNSDLYFTLFYGAARAGIVMAPIGWRLAAPEWAFIVNDTQSKMVFTGTGFEDVAKTLGPLCPGAERFYSAAEGRILIETTTRAAFTPFWTPSS